MIVGLLGEISCLAITLDPDWLKFLPFRRAARRRKTHNPSAASIRVCKGMCIEQLDVSTFPAVEGHSPSRHSD